MLRYRNISDSRRGLTKNFVFDAQEFGMLNESVSLFEIAYTCRNYILNARMIAGLDCGLVNWA